MAHKITDISFKGNADRGCLEYWADGVFISIDGQFFIDGKGVVHHDHWFDEEGRDRIEVLCHLKEENLEYAAYKAGYGEGIVTTTESLWDIPRKLKKAVMGFETFSDAEKFADSVEGGIIVSLVKKDGHQFWTSRGRAWASYQLTAEDYGDLYSCEDDPEYFWHNALDLIKEIEWETPDDLIAHLDKVKKTYDEIEALGDNEQMLFHDNNKFVGEVIPKKTMQWSHDTWTHVIGVMQEN